MNTKISNSLDEIRKRFAELKASLEAEREKNGQLNEEQNRLKQLIEAKESEMLLLQEKLKQSEEELISMKEQTTSHEENPSEEKDVQIDFLVREIDQCIRQIKTGL